MGQVICVCADQVSATLLRSPREFRCTQRRPCTKELQSGHSAAAGSNFCSIMEIDNVAEAKYATGLRSPREFRCTQRRQRFREWR